MTQDGMVALQPISLFIGHTIQYASALDRYRFWVDIRSILLTGLSVFLTSTHEQDKLHLLT